MWEQVAHDPDSMPAPINTPVKHPSQEETGSLIANATAEECQAVESRLLVQIFARSHVFEGRVELL